MARKGQFTSTNQPAKRGRTRGSLSARTKAIMAFEEQVLARSDDVIRLIDEMIAARDTAMVKIFVDKILPNARGRYISLDLTGKSIQEKVNCIELALARGDISIDESEKLMSHISKTAELLELEAIRERLDVLEKSR